MYDCTAEFRQFWLRQRLDECDYIHESGTARNTHPFVVRTPRSFHVFLPPASLKSLALCVCVCVCVCRSRQYPPYYECSEDGLRQAYSGHVPFARVGG